MRDLSLTLRPKFESGSADKAIKTQQSLLKQTQTTVERLNKSSNEGLKKQESLWRRLETATSSFGRGSVRAMDTALGGINRFQRGLEGAVKKVASLKNVILGSAVGGAAIGLGSHILGKGAENVRNTRALTREFGKGAFSDSLLAQSRAISKAGGIEDDDALQGLLPIARAINETRVGDRVGKSTIKDKAQLARVQTAQLNEAAGRFKTLARLRPDMSPEQIGFLLSDAGQGPEGLKGLSRALHMGKAGFADLQRDGKKGKLGNAEMIGEVFRRTGNTEEAAGVEAKSFEGQIKDLGVAIQGTLGDIGATAIDRLNERLGKGSSLAERFTEILEKNKGTIDKLADGFATMVEKLVDLAEKLPAAMSWLSDNKGTLLAIGGVYAGLKVIGGARSLVGNAMGGIGGAASSLLGGGATGTPVFVTNMPGGGLGGATGAGGAAGVAEKGKGLLAKAGMVAAAGLVGYELGTFLDDKSGLSDLISGTGTHARRAMSENDETAATEGNRLKLASTASDRMARIAQLEAKGIAHGDAVYADANPGSEAGMATMKKAGINVDLGGLVVNIGASVGKNAPSIVSELMPHLKEQLTRVLMGAVPAPSGG